MSDTAMNNPHPSPVGEWVLGEASATEQDAAARAAKKEAKRKSKEKAKKLRESHRDEEVTHTHTPIVFHCHFVPSMFVVGIVVGISVLFVLSSLKMREREPHRNPTKSVILRFNVGVSCGFFDLLLMLLLDLICLLRSGEGRQGREQG